MGATRKLVAMARARRRAQELRRRRIPPFATSPAGDEPATIYYLTPDHDVPSGGIRVIYRHVDALNAMSIPACVVHHTPEFRCTWFDNDTRVRSVGEVSLSPSDVLVVPEWYGPGLGTDRPALPRGPRIVVFNQNVYGMFDHIAPEADGAGAMLYDGVDAVLAVSDDNAEYLRYAFPDLPVHVTRNVVDGELFGPPADPPGRRIAYMPRRRGGERGEVLHLLAARGVLAGWELVPIDGRSERETAALLRGSAVFLSFSEREGFGMPPAEAMAAGCYVVGFTGLAGRDFFDPAYCRPVPEGDVLAFARAVEEACGTDPDVLAKAGRLASQTILDRYSEANLRQDLRTFYGAIPATGHARTSR
jgi:glycosyltransferase involved in cell wall biosynthesis